MTRIGAPGYRATRVRPARSQLCGAPVGDVRARATPRGTTERVEPHRSQQGPPSPSGERPASTRRRLAGDRAFPPARALGRRPRGAPGTPRPHPSVGGSTGSRAPTTPRELRPRRVELGCDRADRPERARSAGTTVAGRGDAGSPDRGARGSRRAARPGCPHSRPRAREPQVVVLALLEVGVVAKLVAVEQLAVDEHGRVVER